MPPPLPLAVLPMMVQLVSVTLMSVSSRPPPLPPAVLSLTVQSVSVEGS
jgi:hypothetical protein